MSDDELMAEARKYEQNLLNFFWRQGVSHFEGEDLVQETYLRLWNYRREYEPSAKLSTFLFLMARQVRIDALRRQSRRERREERWGKEQPATQAPETHAREDVRWAVSQLSDPLREVVELGVFQEMPYAEVSAILGIPVGTVKSRMSNAIRKLKEVFDDAGS
ncbi:MAG: sigma-70 family RNA polymerase sigma factor [Kiritimatiellae bacterium]|nr:sigma-70 family RNA polymerase sigma factor [Kiritimatiellia bacterium]